MSEPRFRVEFSHIADKQLQKLDESVQKRIVNRVTKLAANPRPAGIKKIAGTLDFFRLRIGDYRVIYTINDNKLIVLVLKVGHRRDIYKK